MTLPIDQIRRWSRQVRLPQIGLEGQEKLAKASVAIVGVGGLGCPAALYLAAAGIGTLGLIDDDAVDSSNLQRQVLFTEAEIGHGKVEVAAQRLRQMQGDLTIVEHPMRLTAGNALEMLEPYDIIIDGNDNFPTRYAVNDACVLLDKPNVYGSVLQFEGRVSLFVPGQGPCYRCMYAEPPPPGVVPNCAEAGVLGVLPGVIGSMQAAEAMKWICGIGELLTGRLMVIDMLTMAIDEFAVERNPECALCGNHPTITEPVPYSEICSVGDDGFVDDEDLDTPDRITPRIAKRRIDAGESIVLLDVREPIEWEMAPFPVDARIPLGELPVRWKSELHDHQSKEVIVVCHHGIRSQMAVDFLRQQGFKLVKNLVGGIDRWSVDADHTIPRY